MEGCKSTCLTPLGAFNCSEGAGHARGGEAAYLPTFCGQMWMLHAGCSQGTGTGGSLGDQGSQEVKLAHAPASLRAEFRIPSLPDTVHGSAASRFATPVHLAGIYEPCVGLSPVGSRAAGLVEQDLTDLGREGALPGFSHWESTPHTHTHTRSTPDPSTFWGATTASNESPVIYLKLRKRSPYQHPPAPESSEE